MAIEGTEGLEEIEGLEGIEGRGEDRGPERGLRVIERKRAVE
jgi:hypothetical protein